jgi:uncharacterized protein (TIGR03382 family)
VVKPIWKGRRTSVGLNLLVLVGLLWLCQAVGARETLRFDRAFLLGLHQWANPVWDRVMLEMTRLGNPEVVVVVVALGLGWLVRRRRWRSAVMLLFVCLGALMLNRGMKLAFGRPRPLLWPRLIEEVSYGFPSGHALGALVLYGFLAYLLAQRYPGKARSVYLAAGVLIGGIGLSRLYLGVHYPTDVLAGYGVGWLWLSGCLWVLRRGRQV